MSHAMRMLIYLVISAAIVTVSWPSLRDPRSHGFYRLFAFEAILILFLQNVEHWFDDTLTIHQTISWALLAGSLLLVVLGLHALRTQGQPEDALEATTKLVSQGVYRYIRHPLYSSLLLLAWGIFLKKPSPLTSLPAAVATVALLLTARVEEAENLEKFGRAYVEYMASTKRFIPFLF